jgi:hypothetical protein
MRKKPAPTEKVQTAWQMHDGFCCGDVAESGTARF